MQHSSTGSRALSESANRVLRNTYWMLVLSLVPMMSRLLSAVLGLSNGPGLALTAFAATVAVFAGMALLSTFIKRDLSGMGKMLLIGGILLIVAMLANMFIQSSALQLALATAAAGLFSLFVLYDLKEVRDGRQTNYVVATLSVYLSLYNVFTSILQILGIAGSGD